MRPTTATEPEVSLAARPVAPAPAGGGGGAGGGEPRIRAPGAGLLAPPRGAREGGWSPPPAATPTPTPPAGGPGGDRPPEGSAKPVPGVGDRQPPGAAPAPQPVTPRCHLQPAPPRPARRRRCSGCAHRQESAS